MSKKCWKIKILLANLLYVCIINNIRKKLIGPTDQCHHGLLSIQLLVPSDFVVVTIYSMDQNIAIAHSHLFYSFFPLSLFSQGPANFSMILAIILP